MIEDPRGVCLAVLVMKQQEAHASDLVRPSVVASLSSPHCVHVRPP
jgi:hypothetical protein